MNTEEDQIKSICQDTPFQFSFWTLLKNEQNDNLFFLTKHLKWYFLFI